MPRTFREQTARLLIELMVVGVDIINKCWWLLRMQMQMQIADVCIIQSIKHVMVPERDTLQG